MFLAAKGSGCLGRAGKRNNDKMRQNEDAFLSKVRITYLLYMVVFRRCAQHVGSFTSTLDRFIKDDKTYEDMKGYVDENPSL